MPSAISCIVLASFLVKYLYKQIIAIMTTKANSWLFLLLIRLILNFSNP